MSLSKSAGDLLDFVSECWFFELNLLNNIAFFETLLYTTYVVIPLITSLISNPNTPFEQNRTHPCVLFCFLGAHAIIHTWNIYVKNSKLNYLITNPLQCTSAISGSGFWISKQQV